MAVELSRKVLEACRERLEARHRELKEEIRQALLTSDKPQYQELAGSVHDTGDQAIADVIADLNLAFADRQVKEIQEIEAALQRMQRGLYGFCADCGELIDPRRLEAYPTARRCRDCQELHEQRSAPHSGS